MFYCFIKEDLENIEENNPLILQAIYAEKLGKICICDLNTEEIVWKNRENGCVEEEIVWLRTTCDNQKKAIEILKKKNINLIENEFDIFKIENWYNMNLTQRQIYKTDMWQIENGCFSEEQKKFLQKENLIFIKSVQKGFSTLMESSRIISRDESYVDYLKKNAEAYGDEMMMTKCIDIKKDSLGKKESRHFVVDGKILNSSRTIHTLNHYVSSSHIKKAESIVEHLRNINDFPRNYVLDIGEYSSVDKTYLDIVEINPISSAMCYVNNSIFMDDLEEIKIIHNNMSIGFEFCYDMLSYPQRYHMTRVASYNYSYDNTDYETWN